MFALTARIARAVDEGEELPDHPHRLIEENLWRAIRYGLSGELIDLESGDVLPARARIEQLIQWTMPVAEELGVASYLTVPSATPAERQIAKHEAGQSMEEIYAEEVLEAVRV
jgi:carboxylate-amine ligase